MKKLLAIILALTFILSMFAMTACSEGDPKDTEAGDSKDTGTEKPADSDKETETDEKKDTETDKKEEDTTETLDEPNYYPYEHATDFEIGSIWMDWGAPRKDSVYFEIDIDHVIHDGKGTWSNSTSTIGTMVFDGLDDTVYDCDEGCGDVNTEDMNYGVILEDWNDDTTKTGYVGAWIEEGVILHQIRFFPRVANLGREIGCKIQASVDGVEWVDLVVIEANDMRGYDYELYDIDDETVYYYVRYLGRDQASYLEYNEGALETDDYKSYVNIAELEIWGVPANK